MGGGNAYIKSLEPQYRYIDKKIIVEKFLDSRSDVGLTDYKIYCFHGEPKVVLTCLDRISGDTKFYNYDLDWNSLDHFNSKQEEHNVPRPEFFTEMLEAARKLATPFPFVRVDFYEVPDRGIVFGELTFTPAGGFDWEKPRPFQEYLGQFLNLEKV